MNCADCGIEIRERDWQLEDGRTVCESCCIADLTQAFGSIASIEFVNQFPIMVTVYRTPSDDDILVKIIFASGKEHAKYKFSAEPSE